MHHDLTAPAELVWHPDEEEPPEDWSDAISFPTLREALEAIVNGAPQTGHAWVRSLDLVFGPRDIEALWPEPDEP